MSRPLATATVAAFVLLGACTAGPEKAAPSPSEPTRTSPTAPATASPSSTTGPYGDDSTARLSTLPIRRVTVSWPDGRDPANLQKFADDIADGSINRLIRNCWTLAPAYITDRYGTLQARGAILDALSHGVEGVQTGYIARGDELLVVIPQDEAESSYPCPRVDYEGISNAPREPDLAWMIHRLAGRLDGHPVNPADTEATYWLYCDNNTGHWEDVDGNSIAEPGVAHGHAEVDGLIRQLDGRPLRVASDPEGHWVTATASDGSTDRLVVYLIDGGPCVGDVWPGSDS